MDDDDKIQSIIKVLPLVSKKYNNTNQIRQLIDQLATRLDVDAWINLSYSEFDMSHMINKYNKNIQIREGMFKPNGLYLSKGDWLFHAFVNITKTNREHDRYLNIIWVDYTRIKVITSIEQLVKFTNKYKILDNTDNSDNTNNSDNEYVVIDWYQVANKYEGICIIPDLSSEINKIYGRHEHGLFDIPKEFGWIMMLDVSTLVIWSPNPIKSHQSYLLLRANQQVVDKKKFLMTMVKRLHEKIKKNT